MIIRPRSVATIALLCITVPSATARALDKQGSAHGGAAAGVDESGFGVSGALMLGVSLRNDSYAARPDNTGLALMRYAAHADVDLIGRKLSIPLDVNMFSDKQQDGLTKLRPSELDLIAGVTTTWDAGPGAIEAGARVEHDAPVDREGKAQTYADVRGRYLFSLAPVSPGFAARFPHSNLSAHGTLGWFAYNETYYARPDNTGLALFRYALHNELALFDGRLAFALDLTFFTDKQAENVFRPSELDLTPEIITRFDRFEVHLAYERDMPVDTKTLVQSFVYLLAACGF
jgi:hypothetical protein